MFLALATGKLAIRDECGKQVLMAVVLIYKPPPLPGADRSAIELQFCPWCGANVEACLLTGMEQHGQSLVRNTSAAPVSSRAKPPRKPAKQGVNALPLR